MKYEVIIVNLTDSDDNTHYHVLYDSFDSALEAHFSFGRVKTPEGKRAFAVTSPLEVKDLEEQK